MLKGSKLVWLCLGALAGVALLFLGVHSLEKPARSEPQRAPSSTGTESRAELAAMSRELSLLRAELGAVKDRVYQAPPAPSTREEPISDPTPPPSAPQAVTLEAAQAHFDQVFSAEIADPSWARAEEVSIGEFFRREGGDGSSLETITCRSTMCRMQLRFSDDHSRDAFKLKLGTPPLNNGGFYKEQGETELVYFAARAGHPLPPVPAE